MYTASGFVLRRQLYALFHFPSMLVVGSGLCINNAIAVVEAFLGMKSEFVRTPKSGSTNTQSKPGRYKSQTNLFIGTIELLSGIYCFFTLIVYLDSSKYLYGFFIAAYSVGLTTFGLLTLKENFFNKSILVSITEGSKKFWQTIERLSPKVHQVLACTIRQPADDPPRNLGGNRLPPWFRLFRKIDCPGHLWRRRRRVNWQSNLISGLYFLGFVILGESRESYLFVKLP